MTSNLPPGVTNAMIEAHFADGPCEVCGYRPDDCVCPVCPRCGEQGDPDCYKEVDLGICGSLFETGLTWDQKIGQSKRRIEALREEISNESMYQAYCEGEKEKEG